jgi:hypothetical protein
MVPPVALTIDLDMRQEREFECPCCKAQVQRTWNYVSRDDEPHAVYFANCYHHRDKPHEVWIDVILGTWGEGEFDDHVTFGCRVGPVLDSPEPAATLVQACLDGSGGPVNAFLLSREDGLAHPWLPDFWTVVDFVLVEDPLVGSFYRTL